MTNEQSREVNLDLLIETSWEVCNKIGGIYAVLSTKAKTLQTLYKDKVVFIGPDVWSEENPSPFFIENNSVLRGWKDRDNLPDGVTVRVGRWDVPGRPIAVLVKFDSMYAIKDKLYARMWELYGVDSLHAYGDYDEACAFSHAAGIVIESLCKYKAGRGAHKRIIAHFDEWTTGMSLLYVKDRLPEVATIFTTHATSIGRSICGNNKPLYDYLHGYDGDQMAAELNMQSKHSLEKAAAHAADCFTTVSDITADECEQLLQIRPAVVTPNGFEKNFVPTKAKFDKVREAGRHRLVSIASALTGRRFDEENVFLVATSGRCEYRNKGLDVYLDAIANMRVNREMPVIAFVLVPAWSDVPRSDLRQSLESNSSRRLDDPVMTHTLHNPESDAVYQRIHSLWFGNRVEDNTFVIYVPCYLNGNDGIVDLPYYDALIGVDATVFPSYYEPWGYTPLESVAFGVPTVTTSLSGFGRWIMASSRSGFDYSGVEVINRTDANYRQVVDEIAAALTSLVNAGQSQRRHISEQAMATADRAAWQYFMTYYVEAFDIALEKAQSRCECAEATLF